MLIFNPENESMIRDQLLKITIKNVFHGARNFSVSVIFAKLLKNVRFKIPEI